MARLDLAEYVFILGESKRVTVYEDIYQDTLKFTDLNTVRSAKFKRGTRTQISYTRGLPSLSVAPGKLQLIRKIKAHPFGWVDCIQSMIIGCELLSLFLNQPVIAVAPSIDDGEVARFGHAEDMEVVA